MDRSLMSSPSSAASDLGWWERWPWRLVQTNLREVDMRDMDAERYVASLEAFGATVAMINTSGIVASWSSTALPAAGAFLPLRCSSGERSRASSSNRSGRSEWPAGRSQTPFPVLRSL